MVFLSMAFKELTENNVLLLYISAEGTQKYPAINQRLNGLTLTTHSQPSTPDVSHSIEESQSSSPTSLEIETNTLLPIDLLPFTRKKLFVIIESNNSDAFKNFNSTFHHYCLCLLSPKIYDMDSSQEEIGSSSGGSVNSELRGGLLTLFLYSPVTAFCVTASKKSITQEIYDRLLKGVSIIFDDIFKLLMNMEGMPQCFMHFVEEDFLRTIILRFIFCHYVLSLHKLYNNKPQDLPQSSPSLPKNLLNNATISSAILKLVSVLGAQDLFVTEENS